MLVKMGVDTRTTTAHRDDRKGFTAIASSDDDDEVEPGIDADAAIKLVTTPHLDHAYAVDSDDDSLLSSEYSLETGLTDRSAIITGKTQDTSSDDDLDAGNGTQKKSASGFCTIQNPMYDISIEERELGKQNIEKGDAPKGKDEGDDDHNYAIDDDERSRLMAAAQAASIPSNDGFSDESEGDVDERSRLMAAAQAASIPSSDGFSNDSNGDSEDDVDERSRLMAAAQAASIPSNDSFSDDGDDGSRRLISTMPNIRRETSTRVVPTLTKAQHDSEDLESDEDSSFLSVESYHSERNSIDDESVNVNCNVQKKTTLGSQISDHRFKISRKNLAEAGEDDSDDGSNRSARSDYSRGNDGKKPQKWDLNSASFPATSTSFKWSNVKTKIFYSFRALKASASSSSEGSRTISVKNLARDVTDDCLRDFFQNSGSILDIWIVRDAQSGLGSAYVEFQSSSDARKALQKSGKKLEGRVIMCDTAYENSRGSRSVPGSGHGEKARSELFESDLESVKSRIAESHAALKIFDPELQEGDAKFLSRFDNEKVDFSPHGDVHPSKGNTGSVGSHSRPTGGNHIEGSKGKVIQSWPDSCEDSILMSGKNQSEIGESVYYDAKNLESQDSLRVGWKTRSLWRRRKTKLTHFLWSWKWPGRWHLLHLVKQSSKWARRRSCMKIK